MKVEQPVLRMSYVPDYVRRVQKKPLTSPSNSVNLNSSQSPAPSSGASTPTSSIPSRSPFQDGQFFQRSQRRTSVPTHSGNWVSPQNKVCSRQSIKDRVKNLESGAAVKLEVLRQPTIGGHRGLVRYHSTDNYRRKSGLRYNNGSKPTTPSTPLLSTPPSEVDETTIPCATPDIIRAHIKPIPIRQRSSPVLLDRRESSDSDTNFNGANRENSILKVAPERLDSSDNDFDFGTDIEETKELKSVPPGARVNGPIKNNIGTKPMKSASSKINDVLNGNKDIVSKERTPPNSNQKVLNNKRNNSVKIEKLNDMKSKFEDEEKNLKNKSESSQSSKSSSRKSSTSGPSTTSPKIAGKWKKVKPENEPVVSHPKLKYKMSEPPRRHKKFLNDISHDDNPIHKAASFPKLSMSAGSSVEDVREKNELNKKKSKEVSRSFSLLWKAPSKEALQRFHGSPNLSQPASSYKQVDVDKVRHHSVSSDIVTNSDYFEQSALERTSSEDHREANPVPQRKNKTTSHRQRSTSHDTTRFISDAPPEEPVAPDLKKPQNEVVTTTPEETKVVHRRKPPEMLILDVQTPTATVPVELRSPRHETQTSITRQAARDKRNACVFIMPSSDSDNDQLFANYDKQQPVPHIQPVKFVPSLLQRNYAKSISSSGTETSPKTQPKSNGEAKQTQKSPDPNKDVPRRRHTRSMKRASRSKSSDARPALESSNHNSRHRSNSFRSRRWDGPSPRQQAVASVVKYGNSTDENEQIPFIDDHHHQQDTSPKPIPASYTQESPAHNQEPTNHITTRVVPLAMHRRTRRNGRTSPPRRESYIAAVETNGNFNDRYDSSTTSDTASKSGVIGRSNSADSILAFPEMENNDHRQNVVKRRPRAKSVDRNTARGVHRRSYQMATSAHIPPSDSKENLSTPKRQPSIHKLKHFFGENTPTVTDAAEESRKSQALTREASRYIDLAEQFQSRAGFLNFKVATIEKGKRSSSQKSWKLVWAVLIDTELFLCKDWSRTKSTQELVNHYEPPKKLQLEEETLVVGNSLVSIAYNYQKKRNVFKLTTVNGSEYLFQAEDSDDMLAWIKVLQESAHGSEQHKINKDLILRKTNQIEAGILTRSPSLYRRQQSPKTDKRTGRKRSPKPTRRNNNLQVKDVDGSRRFKWRGSVNKIVKKFGTGQPFLPGGTFTVHLEDCPQSADNEYVPFVVDLCCRIVEERGLSFTGIYRVPGNNASLTLLKDDLNNQGIDAYQGEDDERFKDLNVVSSLLKLFFRKLPDPLFTNELYNDFIQMNRSPDPELRLKGLRQLVHMLPAPHYETLKFLTLHLRKIADHSHENKMEVRNLAIVFGPTLVRSTASDNMTTMVKDMSDQCRIVESVIQHAEWFFKEEATESDSSENVVIDPLPDQPQHMPVPSINHLLANVGRTPGDNVSGSLFKGLLSFRRKKKRLKNANNTSESSKSKNSYESEKDSFSKEVFEKLFGRKNKKDKSEDVDSADEHGGFESVRVSANHSKKSIEAMVPQATKSTSTPPQSPATSHKPLYEPKDDISARLYEFYVEHLDKMSKAKFAEFSSTESSPQVTPRLKGEFVYSIPDVAMVEKRHVRQKSDGNVFDPYVPVGHQHNVTGSQFKSSESLNSMDDDRLRPNDYRNNPLNHSTPLRSPTTHRQPSDNRRESQHAVSSDVSSLGGFADDEQSNVTAHNVGNDVPIKIRGSLEEKLKALTDLNSKPIKRASDHQPYHEKLVDEPVPVQKPRPVPPPKPAKLSNTSRIVAAVTSPIIGRRTNLKRTNPSVVAGELVGKSEPKKTTQKLYDERRMKREFAKQQRHAAKAEKKKIVLQANPTPEVTIQVPSDESGAITPDCDLPKFNRMDPKRRVIARTHEDAHISHNRTRSDQNIPPKSPERSETKRRSFQKKIKKVARRHTLGAGDFPDHKFWEVDPDNLDQPNSSENQNQLSPTHASTSLCDLTAAEDNAFNQQLSAVDRLLPKVPTTHSTIRSWMLQERMKNRSGIFNRQEIIVAAKPIKS